MNIGYCTNVHAGADLATTRENLTEHALAVRDISAPNSDMGIGLWLSARTARSLIEDRELDAFADWLRAERLLPFTLNGFPYGDFHQNVVKHKVYLPTWAEPARLDYTLDLIHILHRLLPVDSIGSISTLPLLWGAPAPRPEILQACAEQLVNIAVRLQELEESTGRLIHICIEPEPGCAIQTSHDIVQFFDEQLRPAAPSSVEITRYLRVCHDVCHAAVMFEEQADVIKRYETAGLLIGKVQVSSAIQVPWHTYDIETAKQAAKELQSFAEDRYLHQTVVDRGPEGQDFLEDLPLGFAKHANDRGSEWRVHFHVPIYLESFGHLKTTRQDIFDCMQALNSNLPTPKQSAQQVTHFEVETYAWNVLPQSLQHSSLADGIAAELDWFQEHFANHPGV